MKPLPTKWAEVRKDKPGEERLVGLCEMEVVFPDYKSGLNV